MNCKVFFLFQEDITQSKFEKFKYFTSLILGTVCIVCIFAFLFLVPFVLDPAVSTLLHRFVDQPVTCKVTQVDIRHGSKDTNCKWSSCREGCTADIFVCYQVGIALYCEILEIAHVCAKLKTLKLYHRYGYNMLGCLLRMTLQPHPYLNLSGLTCPDGTLRKRR